MSNFALLAPVVVLLGSTQAAAARVEPETEHAASTDEQTGLVSRAELQPLAEAQANTLRLLARSPKSLSGIACGSSCQTAYAAAFLLLAQDRPAEALEMLELAMPEIEDALLLASAATLMDLAETRHELMALEARGLLGDGAREGRFAVVGWTTLGALSAGVLTGAMLELPDARSNVLMVMAMTGTGLAASLIATRDTAVSPGAASFYGAGLLAGGLIGWQGSRMAGLSPQVTSGVMMAAGAAGGALGYWRGKATSATRTGSTMLLSGLALGSAAGFLLVPIVEPSENIVRHGLPLAGTALGVAVGGLAADRSNLSRTRILLMDLGALVGGVGMGGLGIAILDEQPAALVQRVVPAMALVGMAGGTAISLLMSRGIDGENGIAATSTGALLERQGEQWSFGLPLPVLLAATQDDATPGLILLSGEL